jgi:hypothetical protein
MNNNIYTYRNSFIGTAIKEVLMEIGYTSKNTRTEHK